jgi:hypothetical protein
MGVMNTLQAMGYHVLFRCISVMYDSKVKDLNMILVPAKMSHLCFGPCKKFILIYTLANLKIFEKRSLMHFF